MCTVSVIPRADGFRLLCNRDERRTRGSARPPARYRTGRRESVFPIDAQGGGTWIGVNDAGLALALLNRGVAGAPEGAAAPTWAWTTRGVIVPWLLACQSVDEVLRSARRLPRDRFQPFRVLAVMGHQAAVVAASTSDYSEQRAQLTRPLMVTSSSLGDALVDPPRRALFDAVMRRSSSTWLEGQVAFHAHAWPARRELSVLMSRPDARTVSRVLCDVGAAGPSFSYEPIASSLTDGV